METDGGGWTVFQRRKDGSVDFYRNWVDYEEGFGDLNGEFWLGLSKIHRLTQDGTNNTLRVDLRDFDNETRYAKYTFNIGDSATEYTITLGGYSGDAGDSMIFQHNGMKFSTIMIYLLIIVLFYSVELGGMVHVINQTSMVFILKDIVSKE